MEETEMFLLNVIAMMDRVFVIFEGILCHFSPRFNEDSAFFTTQHERTGKIDFIATIVIADHFQVSCTSFHAHTQTIFNSLWLAQTREWKRE